MAKKKNAQAEKARTLYESGLSLADIAKEMGVSSNTVRSWKKRNGWGKSVSRQYHESVAKPKDKKKNREKPDAKEEKAAVGLEENPEAAVELESVPEAETEKLFPEAAVVPEVGSVAKNEELNNRQKLFCLFYVKCFNPIKAYMKAYECNESKARNCAYKLLMRDEIKKQIEELRIIRLNDLYIREEDIFQKFIDIAFADINDYVTYGTRTVLVLDKKGNAHEQDVQYVDVRESSQVDGTLISEIGMGRYGARVKLHDKTKAME